MRASLSRTRAIRSRCTIASCRSGATSVHAAVVAICADYPQCELDVLAGKFVVEVKPSGFNKGTGIRELMKSAPFRGRRPIFIGDDVTDEAAFAVLPEFGGLGFSVGRRVARRGRLLPNSRRRAGLALSRRRYC